MAGTNSLFSLQGRFSTVKRKKDGSLDLSTKTWLGNVEEATLEVSVDKEEKKESFSGQRGVYGTIITGKTITLNMTLDEWLPEVLALSLYGKQLSIKSKNIKDEIFPTVSVDERIQLDNLFISDLTITDSAPTPQTLVEGKDYEVVSYTSGDIKIIDPATFTQPFKASYTSSDATSLAIFSEVQAPERFLIFEGIDTQNNKEVYAELYRVQFDPTSSFGLINESFGTLPLSGSLLIDSARLTNDELGGYARIVTKEPSSNGVTTFSNVVQTFAAVEDKPKTKKVS